LWHACGCCHFRYTGRHVCAAVALWDALDHTLLLQQPLNVWRYARWQPLHALLLLLLENLLLHHHLLQVLCRYHIGW
jgi:hypothetical protein